MRERERESRGGVEWFGEMLKKRNENLKNKNIKTSRQVDQ